MIHYQVLGFSGPVPFNEVKKRYKELAKQWHPDINKQWGSEEKFKHINHAFQELKRMDELGIVEQPKPQTWTNPKPTYSPPPKKNVDKRPPAAQTIFRIFSKYPTKEDPLYIEYPDSKIIKGTRIFLMIEGQELSLFFSEDKDLPLNITTMCHYGPVEIAIRNYSGVVQW